MESPIPLKRPAWLEEFQSFIMRGNVVDLAVGIIIGAAFTAIVASLVKDLFNPVFGLLLGGIDFSNIFITIKGETKPTLEAAKAAGSVTLNIGLFLNAVIQFLIVAFTVFWLVKVLNTLQRKKAAEAPPAPKAPPAQEVLLGEIRDLLRAQAGK
jgi:large conductance mechanosensitive channel